jgi:hypothetical protein
MMFMNIYREKNKKRMVLFNKMKLVIIKFCFESIQIESLSVFQMIVVLSSPRQFGTV